MPSRQETQEAENILTLKSQTHLLIPRINLPLSKPQLPPQQLLPRRSKHVPLLAALPPQRMQILPRLAPQLLNRPRAPVLLRLLGRQQQLSGGGEEPPQPVALVHLDLGLEVDGLRQRHVGHGQRLAGARSVQAADAPSPAAVLCLALALGRRG